MARAGVRSLSSSSASTPAASSLAATFLPSLLGAPRASRAAVATVRWRSAFAHDQALGHKPRFAHDQFPPFSSIQVAPFSTDSDNAARRERAERRRARLRGAPTMTKEREQVTGEPVYDDRAAAEEGRDPRRQIDAMSDGQPTCGACGGWPAPT